MSSILLFGAALIVVVGVMVLINRRQSTSASESIPREEDASRSIDRAVVESARDEILSSLKKPNALAEKLTSADFEIVHAVDTEAYAGILRRETSRTWIAIIRDKGDEYAVSIWIPNLQGQANLFNSTYAKNGERRSGGAILHSSILTGEAVAPPVSAAIEKDGPLSFGSKSQWLAIRATNPAAVAALLELENVVEIDWNEGVETAYEGDKVFISPPINEWTLALDTSWMGFGELLDDPELLARWSGQLHTAIQHFVCDRRSGSYGFMRAENGKLLRAFFETDGETKIDLGDKDTSEENSRKELETSGSGFTEGEDLIFALASQWSVDPDAIDDKNATMARGLLGDIRVR